MYAFPQIKIPQRAIDHAKVVITDAFATNFNND